MVHWLRFERSGRIGFGTLDGTTVHVHDGDMYGTSRATGETLSLDAVALLTPTQPSKMIALWNNLRALGAKLNVAVPDDPLYLLKGPNSFLAHGQPISTAGLLCRQDRLRRRTRHRHRQALQHGV